MALKQSAAVGRDLLWRNRKINVHLPINDVRGEGSLGVNIKGFEQGSAGVLCVLPIPSSTAEHMLD